MEYPDYKSLTPNHCRETYIKAHYKELYDLLIEKYPETLSFGERLYWFYNSLNDYPVCKECGNRTKFMNALKGYCLYCSPKCSNSSEAKISTIKATNIERYGGNAPACSKAVQDKMKSTKLEKYGDESYNNRSAAELTMKQRYGGVGNASDSIRNKQQKTMVERYGESNPMHVPTIKEQIRRDNIKKYGVEWVFQRKDVIQKAISTCIDRYDLDIDPTGISSHMQIPGVIKHITDVKKEHKTLNTSSIEEQFAEYLHNEGIKFIRQYRSALYPFACDFYFPDCNLYLEIQGNWTHGKHPFNKCDADDALILEKWRSKNTKFYNNAIETWTVRDPAKRETAKKNNLNYLEVFTNKIKDVINEYTRIAKRL